MSEKFRYHNQKRTNGKRGYRLHDERIAYSGGTGSMRSIKYELVDPTGINGLRDQIAEAIASDNKWLYGNVNLNDYLEWRAAKTNEQITNGDREPSFLGFWLKALSLGFVFSKQSHAVYDFSLTRQDKDDLFRRIPEDLRNKLKKDSWLQFYKARKDGKTGIDGIWEKIDRNGKKVLPDGVQDIIDSYKVLGGDRRTENRVKLFISDYTEPEVKDFPQYDSKNVSWHCYPNVSFTEKDPTKLLDGIIKYWNNQFSVSENKKDDDTSNRMALYSLNQGYMYGVLGNFFLFIKTNNDDFKNYLDRVGTFFNYSDDDVEKIKRKLIKLKSYIEPIPEKPQITASWANYNGDFGGRLESWYSNRFEKLKKAPEQMIELDKVLDKISDVLKNQTNTNNEQKLINEAKEYIKDHVAKTTQPDTFINTWVVEKKKTKTEEAKAVQYWVEKIADREFTEKLESLLAELRSKLNEYNQQNKVAATKKKKGVRVGDEIGVLDNILGGTKSEDGESNEAGWQKILSKHIQSAPLFYGESKRQLFERTYDLESLVNAEIQRVRDILDSTKGLDKIEIKYQDETSELKKNEKGNRTINTLARFYERFGQNGYDGNNRVKDILESIAAEIGVSFAKKDTERFYLSGEERGIRLSCIKWDKAITAEKLVELAKLKDLFAEFQNDFSNLNLLRDTIQLARTVVAIVMTNADKKDQIESNYIFSQLSGYNAILSKKQVVVRYQLQSTGSGGNKNNDFAGGNQVTLGLGNDKSKKGNEIERYFYAFKNYGEEKKNSGGNVEKVELADEKKCVLTKICKAKDNTEEPDIDVVTATSKYPALKIASSRYQIQFLDWFFGRHQHENKKREKIGKKTKLKLSGAFVIAEKTVNIDWSGSNPKYAETDPRIFVSQPFELLPPEKRVQPRSYKNRFIGVDIGEYGLAWSLIKVEDDKVEQLESGFIADNQQQVLKSTVKSWRASQVRQTFTAMDTKVARLRESLIGSYRNQLESLALDKEATLSFEYEVSGFEVGGNRVAKVYNSIKQSSVQKGKENAIFNKQSWGDARELNYAKETTAAGTSQFCTKCHTWASLDIDGNGNYTLENYQDGLFKTKLNSDRYVRLFAPHNKPGDVVKGKDIKGMIYKAMRPNMFVDGEQKTIFGGMKIVEDKLDKSEFKELQKRFGKDKPRGNIGIYICPYTDCHHISDADLQAAFNIAIRGYLKANPLTEGQDKNGKVKEGYLTREKLCELEARFDFDPILLSSKGI